MDFPDDLPAGRYVVYALVDPADHLIYYIGQTRNPKAQLAAHLKRQHYRSRKAEWVRRLKQQGHKPLMQILEIVADEAAALIREQEWIRHFIKLGMPLFNAEAQPKQARESFTPPKQERVRETIIPARQTTIIVASSFLVLVWFLDGRVAVTLNSLCAVLGIRPEGQARRIRRDENLAEHLLCALVKTASGLQVTDVLIAEHVADWVMGLQLKRIAPEKRPLILALKTEIVDALYRRFFGEQAAQPTPEPQAEAASQAGPARSESDTAGGLAWDRLFEGLDDVRGGLDDVQGGQGSTDGLGWMPLLSAAHLADLRALLRALEQTTGRTQAQLEQELIETFGVSAINAIPDEQWEDVLAWCLWRTRM